MKDSVGSVEVATTSPFVPDDVPTKLSGIKICCIDINTDCSTLNACNRAMIAFTCGCVSVEAKDIEGSKNTVAVIAVIIFFIFYILFEKLL